MEKEKGTKEWKLALSVLTKTTFDSFGPIGPVDIGFLQWITKESIRSDDLLKRVMATCEWHRLKK